MKRTLKDWIFATRPWSWPASVTPMIAVTAYLFWQSQVQGTEMNWVNAVLALILLMVLHSAANLVSDYYDHVKGVDKVNSPNGVSWIYAGIFSPKEVLYYGYALLVVSAILGIVLLLNSSLSACWIGVAGLLLTSCYPWLKSHALGDVAVLLGFALLPAIGDSFVVIGSWHPVTMLISLTFGLLTVAILHANNTRDIENDAGAGLNTMCIAIGLRASQIVYLVELIIPYVLIGMFVAIGLLPVWSILTYLTLPMAFKNCSQMLPSDDKELQIATLDQQTAQLQMLFGVLLTISFIIAAFV